MLTERQTQILHLIAQGKTDKEIASILQIAHSTVKNTNSIIYQRLGANNRAEAVYKIYTKGENNEN